jgi:hypothetical protein
MNAEKPVRENAALEIGAEFPLHKPGDRPLLITRALQECLDMLPDGLMEDRLIRAARMIPGRC